MKTNVAQLVESVKALLGYDFSYCLGDFSFNFDSRPFSEISTF